MLIHSCRKFLLFLIVLFSLSTTSNADDDIYFIDAHSQADHNTDLSIIIKRMNDHNIYRTILASRRRLSPFDIADLAESSDGRIIPSVAVKSGGFGKSKPRWFKRMERQIENGRFEAMAEVLMYHAQKGDKAPEFIAHLNDDRVQVALAGALENIWPFVVHIEFAVLDTEKHNMFMQELKELLTTHPEHPFVLIHMGQLDSEEVRTLLDEHSNLHFLTSHTNPVTITQSNQPWINLFDGYVLKAKWKQLFIDHPDRFIFALDNVFPDHWYEWYPNVMKYWDSAVADLPMDVAHAFAHGNAERLWKLEPKQK